MENDVSDYLANILGGPVKVTSNLRTPQKNAQVGGSPTSAHLTGQAYDFVPQGISTKDAADRLVKSGIPFDQIEDGGDHVHISFAPTNRRQVISPKMDQAVPSHDDILSALTGTAPAKSQPTGDYFPPGDSRNGPAAVTVGAAGQVPSHDEILSALTDGASSTGKGEKPAKGVIPQPANAGPSYMGKPFGFSEEMAAHMPFGKDVAAGVPALLDTIMGRGPSLSDLVTGKQNTLGSRYRQNLADYNAAQQGYEAQNPLLSNVGAGVGILASGGPVGGVGSAIPQTLRQLMASGAKGGATLGAIFGAGEAGDGSGGLVDRAKNTALGGATGLVTGGLLPLAAKPVVMVGKAAGATLGALLQKVGVTATDHSDVAANKLIQALNRDQIPAQDVADAIRSAPGSKPVTALDVAGTNTKRVARNLVTNPGQAGDQVTTHLEGRAENQTGRVLADIKEHLSSNTDVYGMADQLLKERSAAAAPLYKAAQAADSTAPFESQYRQALVEATGAKGQIAKQIKKIEQENPGALAARGAAGAETRVKYMELQESLKDAEAARQKATEVFQKAKADGTANVPGATWSPRLQEFLDNPEVQSGLKSGLKLEKQDAITDRRPFKDSDYSIIGYNGEEPIVGAVPTMKSLMVAKEALDARIPEMVDPNTRRLTKAGLSLKKFRDEFVSELDHLNPRYAPAREAWSGPSQSHAAIRKGEDFLKMDVEEIQREMQNMTASDRDFFRSGAARALQDKAKSAADSADLSKRLFGNQTIREQIEAAFGKGSAEKFGTAMSHEGAMAKTKQSVLGGSNTANKLADAEDAHHELAQDILHGGMHGGPKGAIIVPAMNAMKRGISSLFSGIHPEVANRLAEALTAHGEAGAAHFERLGAKQAARNTSTLRRQGIGKMTNRLLSGAAAQGAVRSNQQ